MKAAAAAAAANTPASEHAALMPWIEKYRPAKMDEIASQGEVVSVLKKTLQSNNLPHLLFYGPPGTGKTSTILALARELYGPVLVKQRVMELNASDERGISVVREKIKNFAKTAVSDATVDGRPCPPYKIIILDEADSLTSDAQSALRRTMELYAKVTRFCLVCNYVTRLIEPLASRCAKFRFKSLPRAPMEAKLQTICDAEGVNVAPGALAQLIGQSEGDLRRATMFLQTAARLKKDATITATDFRDIAGVIPDAVIARVMDVWTRRNVVEIMELVKSIMQEGYNVAQLLGQLQDTFVESTVIPTPQKARIAVQFGATDRCLTDGADEELQLLNFLLTTATTA
ncbi:hypothetical protein CXG81DRAFT_13498 [Caulochytrium protostelioides]|uniref:Replication factor C subunit 2 n=1 Tax=Caulochytrium protostelioides TaxID=1555241 RepID=A0A4P9X550_9FUNG|nr:hypothetical protein CXG81DRAFT_13498 [Caulochytrium protostelioides]|eukprot:RKP00215.1 hypothetical protein CXG81DRAFT_13498 [Caulochytrium protostelioides]